MGLPEEIVLADGTLNDRLILKKEPLYQGMNGKFVERFYLSETESYIFKPLTNNDQLGKEAWINEHVLRVFPAIFPKIISYSKHDHPEFSWMILEDLGPLLHEFTEESVLGVVKWMAWWHSLPLESFPDVPVSGLKPKRDQLISDICRDKGKFMAMLPDLMLEEQSIERIYEYLDSFIFSKTLVLSHGDLHVGNYALADGRIVILDWEHAHTNTPFWDLYHLLDMSHPIFPKEIRAEFRERALRYYLEQVELELDAEAFTREYHLFSCVFSIWMILLIVKDLSADDGKWSKEQLERQLNETVLSLRECAQYLV
ncbi:phosphotransferase family protein [Bacillus sp. FJAT-29814]|uniref:phosphotransferase family protein n=1 Tax=Bacillus sp. FJAT-29814 TaxID=1729688 RepID=UPI00082EE593|nr:phosphotransferase [Bacillus sp. FJAT-29814]